MAEPRAVIIGTGRHGSGYTAALLNACGIDCGHEEWWNPIGTRVHDLDVDSTWCALPDLLGRDFPGPIVLQVRHPLDVITSLVAAPDWGPYLTVRDQLVPRFGRDLVSLAVETWLRWNTAALRLPLAFRWSIDGPLGPPEYADAKSLAALLDLECHEPDEEIGIVNSHHDAARLTADDLPDDATTEAMWALAETFGYQP